MLQKLPELPTLSDVTDGDVIHRFKGWKYENGNAASSGDLITKKHYINSNMGR
ncbi:MAG: hypothetical protein L6U99_00935 [Clostridium sp.]|nr:MAG: hypothetical protein L6U99_00935 [Clostridium sp.]